MAHCRQICTPADTQIPDNFNWGDIPVMCHMMDQGAIGVSAVHHMIVSMHLMVVVFYDYFHRIWNDIKNAAKASKGFFYAIMLKFSLVFNLNYGPFGKGAWFADKQSWQSDLRSKLSHTDPWFQERAPSIATDNGWATPQTEEDYLKIWDFVCVLVWRGSGSKGQFPRL